MHLTICIWQRNSDRFFRIFRPDAQPRCHTPVPAPVGVLSIRNLRYGRGWANGRACSRCARNRPWSPISGHFNKPGRRFHASFVRTTRFGSDFLHRLLDFRRIPPQSFRPVENPAHSTRYRAWRTYGEATGASTTHPRSRARHAAKLFHYAFPIAGILP